MRRESRAGVFMGRRELVCLLLIALVLTAGCSREKAPTAAARAPPPTKVVAVVVEPKPWTDTIEALGTARANESVTLTAKVTETVGRVNFEDGDQVEAGAVLVELTGRAEVAQLKEAQAAYSEAEKQYKRLAGVVEQGTITRSALDQQVSMRDQARARADTIRARLSDRVITAPFAGVLGFRRVSQGTLVSPGTEIATLDDVSIIKLDFSIPETYLAAISVGQRIRASTAAYAERVYDGTVTTIDSRIDPGSRAVTIRAAVDNADGSLRPGMLMTVELIEPAREALVIDEISLIQTGGQASVFLIDAQNKAELVAVQVGGRQQGMVEITAGLKAGDRVVVEGLVKLRPGMSVEFASAAPVDTDATTAAANQSN